MPSQFINGQIVDAANRPLVHDLRLNVPQILLGSSTDRVLTFMSDGTVRYIPQSSLVAGAGSVISGENLGDGEGLMFKEVIDQTMYFNTIISTSSVDVSLDEEANEISLTVLAAGVDHGLLAGLGDDDHTQYLLASGTRALTGAWATGAFDITGANKFLVGGATGTYGHSGNEIQSQNLLDKTASESISGATWTYTGQIRVNGAAPDPEALRVETGGVVTLRVDTNSSAVETRHIAPVTTGAFDIGLTGTPYNDLFIEEVQFRSNAGSNQGSIVSDPTTLTITGTGDVNIGSSGLTSVGGTNTELTAAGLVTLWGFGSGVLVDGQFADVIQLTVRGNAAQTANPFVVETSAGTDLFSVSSAGLARVLAFQMPTGAAAGRLLISDGSGVGTWQAQSNVDHGSLGGLSDDDHPQYAALAQPETITELWTHTRQLFIDASSNEISFLVQGAGGQTANLMTLETSAGTDVFTVSIAGACVGSKFSVSDTAQATKDQFSSQFAINATASDLGTVYQGMFYDMDYSQNGAGAAHLEVIRAINIDIDMTHTATAFSGPTVQFMQGRLDAASGVAVASRVFDLQAVVNSTSFSGGASGAYLMSIEGNIAGQLIALKTDSRNAGAGRAVGYQGAATGLTGATGELCGVEGFITSVGTVARVVGLSAAPRAGGGALPTNDKIVGVRSASGHLLVTAASGAIVTGTPSDLSTVSTTHLNFASNAGELYVQGALEVDGKAWFDGDVEMADTKNIIVSTTTGTKIGTATSQKLGFWNATPVVQPSAFTQTYATASKTHANLTSATLTDSTGGTANTTCVAIAGTGDDANINNNFADIIAQVNALRVDLENAKQVLNAVIDDDQTIGIKS